MLMTSVVTKTTAIVSDGCDDDDDNDQDADGLEDARVKMVPKPCRTIPHPTQLCTIAPHKVLHNRCRYLCSVIHC